MQLGDANSSCELASLTPCLQKYTQALDLVPEWDVLLVNRANASNRLGHYQAVESDCLRALAIQKNNLKVGWGAKSGQREALRKYAPYTNRRGTGIYAGSLCVSILDYNPYRNALN